MAHRRNGERRDDVKTCSDTRRWFLNLTRMLMLENTDNRRGETIDEIENPSMFEMSHAQWIHWHQIHSLGTRWFRKRKRFCETRKLRNLIENIFVLLSIRRDLLAIPTPERSRQLGLFCLDMWIYIPMTAEKNCSRNFCMIGFGAQKEIRATETTQECGAVVNVKPNRFRFLSVF